MQHIGRKIFPYVALAGGLAAVAWATSFGTLPPADFSFNNGTEIKTLDPPRSTGQPEGRIIRALFEGLLRPVPASDGDYRTNATMKLQPGMATGYEVSEDGLTYTFTMREGAVWTNGEPVTADDFVWSWRRMLHPSTASQYAYQLWYVDGAKAYTSSAVEVGDRVEVEQTPRPKPDQAFPRGPLARGVLQKIIEPPELDLPEDISDEEKKKRTAAREDRFVYMVEVKPVDADGSIIWDTPGELQAFTKAESLDNLPYKKDDVKQCHYVLPDFEATVGLSAPEPGRLVVRLNSPTAYFADLVSFYPLFPTNRTCVEEHGNDWVQPKNLVCNGPYVLKFRRIRDRIRLMKNPDYYNADSVKIDLIDAMVVESETTGLSMFLNGEVDWTTNPPSSVMNLLKKRDDYYSAPMLGTYFYRVNVTKPPFNDTDMVTFEGEQVAKGVLLRRALNRALDKQAICDVSSGGEEPALSFSPPGMTGYDPPLCGTQDLDMAKRMLKAAGYAGGVGMPKIEVLYNTSEAHRAIAETIERQWSQLGVRIALNNAEWGTYLATVRSKDYGAARAGWIGDYPDPNTFLDMFVTDGENNETGWSNKEYDRLIAAAAKETDVEKRLDYLHQAERILLDELPLIPIYHYVSKNLVSPRVSGFAPSVQDVHPLTSLTLEK